MITRTIPFRDVLHGVAYKFGLDPEQSNFLSNQGIPIGRSIDQWVQRLWPSADFPEWAQTNQFIPDANHLVPWNARAIDDVIPPHVVGTIHPLGRILKVYLIDPKSDYYVPSDTPFTEQDEGLHVGFEHGQAVWIQYLPPPTRFTAVPWLGNITYAKGDIVYSPRTGECYTSKAAGNTGHDPSFSFSPAPPPGGNDPPPNVVPPPAVDTPQQRTPDDPGLVGRTQILVIDFDHFKASQPIPGTFHIPDPPENNSTLFAEIVDENGSLIGTGGPTTADGVTTLQALLASLAASLQASLGGSFIVTSDAKTITIEGNSIFSCAYAFFRPALGYPYYIPISMVSQSFVPATAGAPGLPQKTTVTLTQDQVITGATYYIMFTDSIGATHPIQYTSESGDSQSQILAGLNAAIETARNDDDYFNAVSPSVDPSDSILNLAITDIASVDTTIVPGGSPWWDINLFPRTLANPVMRGAVADLWKEWGQTDKGLAEEQAVPMEQDMAINQYAPQQTPLTDQDRSRSRYKVS